MVIASADKPECINLTLTLKDKQMNLVFLMPKLDSLQSRSFVVDSLRFQAGTFEIDLTGRGELNPAGDWRGRFYPAKGWKKIK